MSACCLHLVRSRFAGVFDPSPRLHLHGMRYLLLQLLPKRLPVKYAHQVVAPSKDRKAEIRHRMSGKAYIYYLVMLILRSLMQLSFLQEFWIDRGADIVGVSSFTAPGTISFTVYILVGPQLNAHVI